MAYYRDVKLLMKRLPEFAAECADLARENADQPLLKEYYSGKQQAYERVLNELETLCPSVDESTIYQRIWEEGLKEDISFYIEENLGEDPKDYDLDRLVYLYDVDERKYGGWDVTKLAVIEMAIEDYNNGGGVY